MVEKWKRIRGYDYAISIFGRVKSIEREIIMKNGLSKTIKESIRKPEIVRGYLIVDLYDDKGHRKNFQIHRLVAENFIDNPESLPFVNHKDENKLNNNVSNLEWCTASYNNTYGKGFLKRKQSHSKTKTKYKYVAYKDGKVFGEYLHKDLKQNGYAQGAVYQAAKNGNVSYGLHWKIKLL